MKKLFAVVLALVLLCGAALGEGIDWAGMSDDELHAAIDAARNEAARRDLVMSEKVVVFEQDGVSVYLTGNYDVKTFNTTGTTQLSLEAVVINDTESTISVLPATSSVNGWDIYTGAIVEISAGKKKKGEFELRISDAEITTYEELEDWTVSFMLFDSASMNTIGITEQAVVHFNE